MPIDWAAARDAFRSVLPITATVPPFALALGVFISESWIDNFTGWTSSFLVFAGSAQFVVMIVLDSGGGVAAAVATILIINSRHIIYSAALQERFRSTPRWFKIAAPYLLVDETFAIINLRPDSDSQAYRMTHFIVAGLTFWVSWNIIVGVGIFAGNVIPESWDLGFSAPLLFIGLLSLSLSDRPGLLAAVVGGLVAVMARDLPNGTGLLIGTLAGMTSALLIAGTPTGPGSANAPVAS